MRVDQSQGQHHEVAQEQAQNRQELIEQRQSERLENLEKWAQEVGLDPKTLPTDRLERIDALVEWAEQNGCEAERIGDVCAWAETQGLEPRGLQDQASAYNEMGEGIDPALGPVALGPVEI